MWVRLLQLLATSTIHRMIMLHTVKMTSCQIGSLNKTAIYNSVSLIQQEVVEVLGGLLCFRLLGGCRLVMTYLCSGLKSLVECWASFLFQPPEILLDQNWSFQESHLYEEKEPSCYNFIT